MASLSNHCAKCEKNAYIQIGLALLPFRYMCRLCTSCCCLSIHVSCLWWDADLISYTLPQDKDLLCLLRRDPVLFENATNLCYIFCRFINCIGRLKTIVRSFLFWKDNVRDFEKVRPSSDRIFFLLGTLMYLQCKYTFSIRIWMFGWRERVWMRLHCTPNTYWPVKASLKLF